MVLKPGVRLPATLHPAVLLAVMAADAIWRDAGCPSGVTVTSAADGVHRPGSLHGEGRAVDLRIKDVAPEARVLLVNRLTVALGADFDVLWESRGDPREHVHVEFDPVTPP